MLRFGDIYLGGLHVAAGSGRLAVQCIYLLPIVNYPLPRPNMCCEWSFRTLAGHVAIKCCVRCCSGDNKPPTLLTTRVSVRGNLLLAICE